MIPAARLSAAIEILADIETRRRPATEALKDWGLAHRFAGSGDRAAIANLVYDALRVRSSAAWLMGEETPRAILFGALRRMRQMPIESLIALCAGERFAPSPLTTSEGAAYAAADLSGAPDHVRGDFPEWLQPHLVETFGDQMVSEMQAMASRAPLDLRVNSLKALRPKVLEQLSHLGSLATPLAATGIRIVPPIDGKPPSIQGEPAFLKGQIEIQDEGSQLVAAMTDAREGEQVLDLCAGAGGKTLALAAMMNNKGQIYATDSDARRLAPIHERLERAGVRNVQVRTPRGKTMPLDDLEGRMDLVLIDAPCTGTGTWRRNPDAKWRMRPGALAERQKEQAEILNGAGRFLKPGGRLAYVTCSVLSDENDRQVNSLAGLFKAQAGQRRLLKCHSAGLGEDAFRMTPSGILLTPGRTGTDGFYLSVLTRTSA